MKYDTLIIGGGPAGLSAALVLGRCVRRVLVLDSGRYRNARSTALHCYLGHDGIVPLALRDQSREQLKRYDTIKLVDATVVKVSTALQASRQFWTMGRRWWHGLSCLPPGS